MKKITRNVVLLLSVFMMLLVSCGTGDPTENLGTVKFLDNDTRALTASFDFDANDYYWKYEAEKLEVPELNIGVTSSQTSVSPVNENGNPSATGLNFTVGPFSAGSWKFTLYAYEYSSCLPEELVFSGSTNAVIKHGQVNPIKVEVSPAGTRQGEQWILEVQNNIPIVNSLGEPISVTGAEGIIICKNIDDPDAVLVTKELEKSLNSTTSVRLIPGNYDIYVEYVEKVSRNVVASGSVAVTLHPNIETVISGSIPQGTGSGAFVASNTKYEKLPNGGIKAMTSVPVAADAKTVLQVASSPVEAKTMDKLTSVELPSGAITGKQAEISVQPEGKIVVEDQTDALNIASIDINLTVDGQAQTEFGGQKATVSTYIQPGIEGKVVVKYDGVALSAEDVSYDKVTGLLVFKTTHFSVYTVEACDAILYNKTTGEFYNDVESAVSYKVLDKVNVNEIILLKDISVGKYDEFEFEYDTVFDLNGHVITDIADSKTNYAIFSCCRDANLTVKGNGTVIASGNRQLFKVGHNRPVKTPILTIENGTFKMEGDIEAEAIMMYIDPVPLDSAKNPKYSENVTVNFNGGTFIWNGTAIQGHGNDKSLAKINIADGVSITGDWYLPNPTDVVIEGGTFTAPMTVIYQKSGSLTLNGGTFTSTETGENIGKHLYWGSGSVSTGDAIVIEASNHGGHGEPTLKGTGATTITSNTGRDGVVVLNLTIGSGLHSVTVDGYAGKYFTNDGEYKPATVKILNNTTITNWNEATNLKDILNGKFLKPDGTVVNIISVDTPEKLIAAMSGKGNPGNLNINAVIDIEKNLDFSNVAWPGFAYSGSYLVVNGNNHVLSNINHVKDASANWDYVGFIDSVGGDSGAVYLIKDLTIDKSTFKDTTYKNSWAVGGFVGFMNSGTSLTLDNCKLTNSVVDGGHWAGGLVGANGGRDLIIRNSEVSGSASNPVLVKSKGSVGGIIGHSVMDGPGTGNFENCRIADVVLNSDIAESVRVGTLIGTIAEGPTTVTKCAVENVKCIQNAVEQDPNFVYGRIVSGSLTVDGKIISSVVDHSKK